MRHRYLAQEVEHATKGLRHSAVGRLRRVNPKNVLHLVGRDEQVYEVVDRDEDLMAIVQAVKEASRVRMVH
jgi:hypothetical protein